MRYWGCIFIQIPVLWGLSIQAGHAQASCTHPRAFQSWKITSFINNKNMLTLLLYYISFYIIKSIAYQLFDMNRQTHNLWDNDMRSFALPFRKFKRKIQKSKAAYFLPMSWVDAILHQRFMAKEKYLVATLQSRTVWSPLWLYFMILIVIMKAFLKLLVIICHLSMVLDKSKNLWIVTVASVSLPVLQRAVLISSHSPPPRHKKLLVNMAIAYIIKFKNG